MALRWTALATAFVALCGGAHAATNGLDSRFGSGGIVALGATPNSALAIHRVRAVAADAAGRILVGGMFIDSSLQSSFNDIPAIGRLDAQGNWDPTFGDHGIFVLPYGASSAPYGGSVDRIAVLSDDGVLISGTSFRDGFGRIGPFNSCTLLIKLTNAGALDTTFAADNSGSMCFDFAPPGDIQWQHHPDAIAARADDSFYMASPTTNIVGDDPSILIGAVARFDKNGVLDPEFGSGGIVQLVGLGAYHLLSMPGGGVLAAGGSSIFAATLLDDSGSPDAGYGTQGVAVFDPQQSSFGGVMQISFDSQQRLVVGQIYERLDSSFAYGIVRLTGDGHGDNSFNGAGQQPGIPGSAIPEVSGGAESDFLTGALPLPDGHILVVGDAGPVSSGDGQSNVAVLRLNSDASYDASFGDAAHPGWASINIGGTNASWASAKALAPDHAGRALAAIAVNPDGGYPGCSAIVRLMTDRVASDGFEDNPAFPACP